MYSRIKRIWSNLEKIAPWLVWSILLGLLLINLITIAVIGYNIPLAEDWTMVAAFTGHEPHFWQWLWSQNNEHRVVVPKLIFLGLLKISGGDFRIGMVYNVLVLAGMAAASIEVAKRLRGMTTNLVDALFPLALLHWGHWPNLFWSWQLSFVTPVALIYLSFLAVLQVPTLSSFWAALLVGLSAILLPLCGAIGLIFMPFFTLWLGYCGWLNWQLKNLKVSLLLWGCGIMAIAVSILYFVGYQKPPWNASSPSIFASLKTAMLFTAIGLTPLAEKAWLIFILIALIFFIPTLATILFAKLTLTNLPRYRRLGVTLFTFNLILLALAMGHGRAGLLPTHGMPLRYILLALLAYLTAFFVWELYSPSQQKVFYQRALLICFSLFLPLNMLLGWSSWGSWYYQGMRSVDRDLQAEVSLMEIAEKHKDFLIHWWEPQQIAENFKFIQETRK